MGIIYENILSGLSVVIIYIKCGPIQFIEPVFLFCGSRQKQSTNTAPTYVSKEPVPIEIPDESPWEITPILRENEPIFATLHRPTTSSTYMDPKNQVGIW